MSFNSALYPNPPTTEKPTTLNPGREMTMEITRTTTEIGTTILETTTNLNREPQESTTVITTTMPAITSTANNANESTTITTTIETTVTSSIPEITADNTKENIPSTTTIITSTTEIKPTTEEIRDSITTGMIESTISDSPDTTTKMSVSTTQTTNEDENTEKSSQITTTELPFIQQTTEVRTTQQQIMEESTTTIPEKTEKTTTKLQTTTELLMTTEREQTTTEETITKQQTTTNQQTIQEITTKQQTTQETTTNQQTTQEITTKQQTTQETTAEQQTPEETTTEGQITEETTTKKQLTEKITTEQQTTIETTTEQKHIEEPATEEIFTEETATEEIFTEETATEHKTTEEINTEQEISLAPESTLVSFPYPDASTPLPAMEITTQIMKENEINPTDEETNVTKRKIRSRKTYKNKRKPRSVLDYVIARYYDNYPPHQHEYPTNFPENYHLESYVPQTQPSFLVQGKYREYQVDYMKYDTVLPFFYVPYLKTMALSFPLDSDKYYLLLLLPLDVNGIDKLICDLRLNDSLKYIIEGLRYRHVVAVIPSFMLKGYVNLTPTLQKLGIRRVFEPRQADFSPMTNFKEIYITNIEQAITVNIRNYVDPDVLSNRGEYGREEPVEFRADHPFLYFVMDTELHVALMAGKIVNPLNSRIT